MKVTCCAIKLENPKIPIILSSSFLAIHISKSCNWVKKNIKSVKIRPFTFQRIKQGTSSHNLEQLITCIMKSVKNIIVHKTKNNLIVNSTQKKQIISPIRVPLIHGSAMLKRLLVVSRPIHMMS